MKVKLMCAFQTATILAKQLVQLRKQKTRTFQASAQMGAIGNQQKMMASNMAMANSMKTATKVINLSTVHVAFEVKCDVLVLFSFQTMTDMNKIMDPMKTAQTMQEFQKQNMKMEMTEETSE